MESKTEKQLGRNEPCPCGSGKKYKRCHGVDAAPVLNQPVREIPQVPGMPNMNGFDPSKMDPQAMSQMMGVLQRLPKGQLQRLQGLMQKAMAGKDVSKEANEFEKILPPELRTMAAGFMAQAGTGATAAAPDDTGMSETEAKKIVQEALSAGKISAEEAASLLKTESSPAGTSLWNRIRGKTK